MSTLVLVALVASAIYNIGFLGCFLDADSNFMSKLFFKFIPVTIGILCLVPLIKHFQVL